MFVSLHICHAKCEVVSQNPTGKHCRAIENGSVKGCNDSSLPKCNLYLFLRKSTFKLTGTKVSESAFSPPWVCCCRHPEPDSMLYVLTGLLCLSLLAMDLKKSHGAVPLAAWQKGKLPPICAQLSSPSCQFASDLLRISYRNFGILFGHFRDSSRATVFSQCTTAH